MSVDHESTDSVAFAALIALSGLNVAGWLGVALLAARQVRWMEWRWAEFLEIVDGAGRLP